MKITKDDARRIAQEECARLGWPWLEPVYVRWGWFNYHIWGGETRGGNLMMTIRKRDGKVLRVGMTPK